MNAERLYPDYQYDTPDEYEEYFSDPIFSESDSSDEYFIPCAPSKRKRQIPVGSEQTEQIKPDTTELLKADPVKQHLDGEALRAIKEETSSPETSDCTKQFYREEALKLILSEREKRRKTRNTEQHQEGEGCSLPSDLSHVLSERRNQQQEGDSSSLPSDFSEGSEYALHVVPVLADDMEAGDEPHWRHLEEQWQTHLAKDPRRATSGVSGTLRSSSLAVRTNLPGGTGDTAGEHGGAEVGPRRNSAGGESRRIKLSESARAKRKREALRSLARKLGLAPVHTGPEQVRLACEYVARRRSASGQTQVSPSGDKPRRRSTPGVMYTSEGDVKSWVNDTPAGEGAAGGDTAPPGGHAPVPAPRGKTKFVFAPGVVTGDVKVHLSPDVIYNAPGIIIEVPDVEAEGAVGGASGGQQSVPPGGSKTAPPGGKKTAPRRSRFRDYVRETVGLARTRNMSTRAKSGGFVPYEHGYPVKVTPTRAVNALGDYLSKVRTAQSLLQNRYSRHREEMDGVQAEQADEGWEELTTQWKGYVDAVHTFKCVADGALLRNNTPGVAPEDMARHMWLQFVRGDSFSSVLQAALIPDPDESFTRGQQEESSARGQHAETTSSHNRFLDRNFCLYRGRGGRHQGASGRGQHAESPGRGQHADTPGRGQHTNTPGRGHRMEAGRGRQLKPDEGGFLEVTLTPPGGENDDDREEVEEVDSDWSVDDIDPALLASIRERDGPSPAPASAPPPDSEEEDEWGIVDRLNTGDHLAGSERSSPNPSPYERPQSVLPPEGQQWGGYLWADHPDNTFSELDELEHEAQDAHLGLPPGGGTRPSAPPIEKMAEANGRPPSAHVYVSPMSSSSMSAGASLYPSLPIDPSPGVPAEAPPQYESLFTAAAGSGESPPPYSEAALMPRPANRGRVIHDSLVLLTRMERPNRESISDLMFEVRPDHDFRLITRCPNHSVQLQEEWSKSGADKTLIIEKKESIDKDNAYVGMGAVALDTQRQLYILPLTDSIICVRPAGKRVNAGKIKHRIKSPKDKRRRFVSLHGIDYSRSADLYVVTDIEQHCVMIVNPTSKKVEAIFGRQGVDAAAGELYYPYNVKCCEFRGTENIVVSNSRNNCVTMFTMSGDVLHVFGAGAMNEPYGVCAVMEKIFVCDFSNKRVLCFNMADPGGAASVVLTAEMLGDRKPRCVAVYPDEEMCRVAVTTHRDVTSGTFTLSDDVSLQELRLYETSIDVLKLL